jgi:hypothetical protein
MSQKVYVRATKPALIVGIVALAAFLLFGVIFFVVLMKDGSGIGMAFMIFWIFVVLVIGGALVYNLRHYRNVEKSVAEEIVIPDFRERDKAEDSFVDKLRGLESLRKDGLISEEEFNRKRAEIME